MANVIINDVNLTNIADAIRGKNGLTNTYKVSEMAAAITNLPTGGGDMEPIVLSGDKPYLDYSGNWDEFLIKYRTLISTKDLAEIQYAFYGSQLDALPFELNFNVTSSTDYGLKHAFAYSKLVNSPVIKGQVSSVWTYAFSNAFNLKKVTLRDDLTVYGEGYHIQGLFDYSYNLEEIEGKLPPVVTGYSNYMTNVGYVFRDCYRLRSIQSDFFVNLPTEPSSNFTGAGLGSAIFQNCYSLRQHPEITNLNRKIQVTYNNLFNNCYSLDEIRNLGVFNYSSMTTNRFSGAFTNCARIKALTFETNEDGTPITANWSNQTIDLTSAGYVVGTSNKSLILNYTSGITADKEVVYDGTTNTSYDALKDDPDWFTTNLQYSRYNKASAVETINSLPDCSASGTNVIKFANYAGKLTDGRDIGELSTAEIAVAAAKGWTVTLV